MVVIISGRSCECRIVWLLSKQSRRELPAFVAFEMHFIKNDLQEDKLPMGYAEELQAVSYFDGCRDLSTPHSHHHHHHSTASYMTLAPAHTTKPTYGHVRLPFLSHCKGIHSVVGQSSPLLPLPRKNCCYYVHTVAVMFATNCDLKYLKLTTEENASAESASFGDGTRWKRKNWWESILPRPHPHSSLTLNDEHPPTKFFPKTPKAPCS